MRIIQKYCEHKLHDSPVQVDFARISNYDEDGNEIVTFEKVDYPSIVRSNGNVNDWRLSSLLKAGIDPSFPIHTGYNTRLDGLSDLDKFHDAIDSVLTETENKSE